jgi:cardiolipin synthase
VSPGVSRPEYVTIPNALTLLRLASVPVFLVFMALGNAEAALICFVGAAITDALDGLLARVLHQQSRVGAVLDPVADKLLVFAALSALVFSRQLPWWLWTGVVLRDVFLAAVAWTVRRRRIEVDVKPTRVGKYATFSLSLLVVLVLVRGVLPNSEQLHLYARELTLVAGLAVLISAVQYVGRFGRILIHPPAPRLDRHPPG